MSRNTGRLMLIALASLAIAATPASARAQEPDGLPDELPRVPGDELPKEQMKELEAVAANEFNAIDQWVFNGKGLDKSRKDFEKALKEVVERFDGKYRLTPAQKKKLEVAGGLDIKRFFDRYADVQAEYRRARGDWNKVGNRVFEFQRIQNQPYAELFGDESMLAKTLKKNLTNEQVASHERNVYRLRVEWMAGFLDRRLKLSPDQHRRLVNLVAAETPPLARYGSFDYDAIMFQMSRLPRARLRTALDESQCAELMLRFEQARRMEGLLASEGYVRMAGSTPGAVADSPSPHHEEARR